MDFPVFGSGQHIIRWLFGITTLIEAVTIEAGTVVTIAPDETLLKSLYNG